MNKIEVEQLTDGSFIDTSNPNTMKQYQKNIDILVERLKQTGTMSNYCIIRNDSFFPEDYTWYINSKNTRVEYNNIPLSREIREFIAEERVGVSELPFPIPGNEEKVEKELSKIGIELGRVLLPVKYRSTKHFTLNTALGYTGSYNNVSSNRDYTIIDSIGNFLSSGYAYSIGQKDTYLDISHEGLPISTNAIVLISKEKFDEIKGNKELLKILNQRRLIIYKGDINLAINMVLSENNTLPTQQNHYHYEYDDETKTLIDSSIQSISIQYDIPYNQGHGNMFGKGGHYSDLIDNNNHEFVESFTELIQYLNNYLRTKTKFNTVTINDKKIIRQVLKEVGPNKLLEAIDNYNDYISKKTLTKYEEYKKDRKTIDIETSLLFKETIRLLNKEYRNLNMTKELSSLISLFFYGDTISIQKDAALKLLELLQKENSLSY